MPEVEGLRAFLDDRCTGRAVDGVQLAAISALKSVALPPSALVGLEIAGVHRWGKFVGLDCQGVWLVFHLARAGWLTWKDVLPVTPVRPGKGPLALRVRLDDGAGFDLTEAGTRKGLAVWIVDEVTSIPAIASLGVDPLSAGFDAAALAVLLDDAGRAQLKGVLRSQQVLAGIGNAWSDEILHAAKLSPFKPANGLSDDERGRLHDAIVGTLRAAVARAVGAPPSALKDGKRQAMAVHGRTGEPCPVCGTTIAQVSFADSSWQYCPGCQTGGVPLADRRLSKLLR